MFTCIFASCSDGGNEDPVTPPTQKPEVNDTPAITIDPTIQSSGLSFDVSASEKSITFSTTADWTLSIAETRSGTEWCTASPTSGGKGTATVKFKTTENTEAEDRSVAVTIKAGTASKTFTVTQKGADALLVTTTKYEVSQEGGEIEIEVKANIDYQMEISETSKSWITESASRALTTHKHIFNIAMNEDSGKREGQIIFKSGDKVETVKVYQAGGAILLLSQDEYTVSDAGEIISVDVKSNVEYGVQMPDVDWIIDEASSRAMSSHTLKYVIAPNEGYDRRSAEIIFYDKNSVLKDTLTVIQAQKDAIVISEKNISVAKEGGIVEVEVNTNVNFEVQIPSDITWVSQTTSRALVEKSIYLKVAENTGKESRKVEIVFINKECNISEQISIKQQGESKIEQQGDMLVATISEAGTLKQLLGDYFPIIFSLKINGPINGDDIYNLRKILGGTEFSESEWGRLNTLDLSGAKIVEGGDWYFKTYEYLYTSNNIIGDNMFYRCKKLKHIILPENITSIGSFAFEGCESLISVEIPSSVTSLGEYAFDNCSSLNSVKIPDGVSIIKEGTFRGCSSLTLITLSKKLTIIGNHAFTRCSSLTSIEIPADVETIGMSAFASCNSLKSVNIPDKVKLIGVSAFQNCSLSSIKIPTSITSIGEFAFLFNPLERIDILNLSVWCNINFSRDWAPSGGVKWQLYFNNERMTMLTIPQDIKEIKDYAFSGCNIMQVNIHDNVTSIGNFAFENCNLEKVVIGKECKKIGLESFSHNKITECYSYATLPPKLEESSFANNFFAMEKEKTTLYVPIRCRDNYLSTEWIGYFNDIIEMD